MEESTDKMALLWVENMGVKEVWRKEKQGKTMNLGTFSGHSEGDLGSPVSICFWAFHF